MIFNAIVMSSHESAHSMIAATDVYSLTDFQRNAREHIERLRESGRAEILTVNGRAEVVVQSAEAYQELLDLVHRADSVLGVHRGILDMQEDRGADLEDVLKDMQSQGLEDSGDAG